MNTKLNLPNRLDHDKIQILKELYPEIFSGGNINPKSLYEIITGQGGQSEEESEEFYGLNWAGKREAKKLAFLPPEGTLRRGVGINESVAKNIFIEGDNLEVLRILKESYRRRVKLIYIDPPYNTGHDFIYKDNFREPVQQYLLRTQQADDEGLLTSNPKSGGRYHASWLSMMYPRLKIARDLLSDEGFICVSISDEEYHNLKHLLDEIFGEENHRNTIVVRRYDKNLSQQFMDKGLTSLSVGYEYVVVYSKSTEAKLNPVFKETSEDRKNNGYWKGFWNSANRPTMRYEVLGVTPKEGQWKWSKDLAEEAVKNYIEFQEKYENTMSLEEYWEKTGKTKKFIRRNPNGKGKNLGVDHWIPPSDGTLRSSNWTDILASESLKDQGIPFDAPKNVNLIKTIIEMTTDDGDLILDFFAGSGTTGEAVLELNEHEGGSRQFILVQIPQAIDQGDYKKISEITLSRIKLAINKLRTNNSSNNNNGVQVYQVGDSNFKQWTVFKEGDIEALQESMDLFTDVNFTEGWTEDNIVIELMLKQGFPLNSHVNVDNSTENKLYVVTHYDVPFKMYVCIDDNIYDKTVQFLLDKKEKDLLICLDDSLSDNAKVILSETMKVKTI